MDTTAFAGAKVDSSAMLDCGCDICMGKASIASGRDMKLDAVAAGTVGATISASATADLRLTGAITPGETRDVYSLAVVAGQTYSIALRGTATDGLTDPLLAVFDSAGSLLGFDDDGGVGITSLYTFTAATTGNYFLTAQSFAPGDAGAYTVDVWVKPPADTVPATRAGAVEIGVGTTFSHIDASGDVDSFKVYLEAGTLYTFQLSAGADYNTPANAVPAGEVDTVLTLFTANGTRLGANDNIAATDLSSAITFLPQTSGFYYLDAAGKAGQTGGYTLDVTAANPADFDPLDSIDWVNAANIPTTTVNGQQVAYVYFGDSDENFNQTGDDGVTPMVTIDWNPFEKQQIMLSLQEYTRILGIQYEITQDSSQATFRLLKTESEDYGAYFYPQDPAYGDERGVGVFNVLSGGWSLDGQFSLLKGGYSFSVMLHEFGHAHGLAHPHDTGGGSQIMLGVSGPDSLGIYDLNQGVYTVMSYNDAWETHPDGPTPFSRANIDSGWSGTLSAFDIAALQERYGVVARNTGNDVYILGDANDFGTYYQTIWDSGGTDEIRYNGARAAQIDLTAATLDYSPTGGGVVSFVDDIWGGYTIAGGVVIENASGGSGNDVLIGNAANNLLRGNAGNDRMLGGLGDDTLVGGLGNDTLDGGAGFDTVSYADATAAVNVRLDLKPRETGMGIDTFVSIEGVVGSAFNDTIYGDAGDNVLNGGAGDDRLLGGAGNDTLIGGAGRDSMSGRAGADVFLFQSLGDFVRTGPDKIDDFSTAEGDKLDLSALGDLTFIGTGRFSASGVGEVRYTRGNSTLVSIDANGDGVVDGTIQLNAVTLGAGDFIL